MAAATDVEIEVATGDVDFDMEVPCFAREELGCQNPAVWQSIVRPCGHRRVYCDLHRQKSDEMSRRERELRPGVPFDCSVCKQGPATTFWRPL